MNELAPMVEDQISLNKGLVQLNGQIDLIMRLAMLRNKHRESVQENTH